MKIILTILIVYSMSVIAQDEWERANKELVRLKPSEFSQLPERIIYDLDRRGCTIPQSYFVKERQNVIQGEFKKKGQKDWAVLCSNNSVSSILIYWSSLIEKVSIIASADDKTFLQDLGEGKIGFSRRIEPADAKSIYDHFDSYGGVKPPKIKYQGINDIFAEKASTVWFFHKGKWMELPGAD